MEDRQNKLLIKALNLKCQLMTLTIKNKREPENSALTYNMLLAKIESDLGQIRKFLP